MEIVSTIAWYLIVLFIFYKILDRLIRVPRVGNYNTRYILITGCDSGFGNAAAKRLDKLGCNVFAGCLTETGETELKKVCSERLHTISLDVTKRESVRKAFEYVSSKLPSGKGLWGVLNNAGVINSCGQPDWITVDVYKQQCEVNLWGLIDVTLTFLPLVKRAKGRIVNTSSASGRLCFHRLLPYSISKYGVEAFTDGIRRATHCFGCKASLIEPGGFKTNIALGLKATAIKTWENAPREIQTEYGEEFARHVTATGLSGDSTTPTDLSLVVGAYEHALLGRFPRARYSIGFDMNYIFLPIQWMPEWLGDWILRRLLGTPAPSATKK